MAFQYPPSPHSIAISPRSTTTLMPSATADDDHVASGFGSTGQSIKAAFTFTANRQDGLQEAGSSYALVPPRSPRTPRRRYYTFDADDMTAQTSTQVATSPVPGRPILGTRPPSWKVAPSTSSSRDSSPASRSPLPHQQNVYSLNDNPPAPNAKQQQQAPLAVRRRQSRFDPMARDDDVEDDGYGELGHRHPLRRVAEEDGKENAEHVSLPGIKALFGVAGGTSRSTGDDPADLAEHQQPSPASSASVFASPSLPPLVPGSPSTSPSGSRTSRYSSLASQMSTASETFQMPPNVAGWWAPDFERGSASSSASSPHHPPNHRANSFPYAHPVTDEHADKRRRSDGPPALRDAEESARLRWQAQSRNASFPLAQSPASTPSTGLRSMLYPPQSASAAMSRQSMSGSSGFGTPLTPFHEHSSPGEFPFDRRPAPIPSRNPSLVGGQLAQSFADLSASERNGDRRSPLSSSVMRPPNIVPDRRLSAIPGMSSGSRESSPRPSLPPMHMARTASGDSEMLRRRSVTRSSTPDHVDRPFVHRSSLSELIMARSGDDVALANGRFGSVSGPSGPTSVAMDGVSKSEPVASAPPLSSAPLITGWPMRRESAGSPVTTPGISLNSDGEDMANGGRNKKRPARNIEEVDVDLASDNVMHGMDVLAESASRLQEAEKDEDDGSIKGGIIIQSSQPGAGPKYACAFCAKTFSRPSSLRIHTYSHTGERPFICEEPSCRRRFSVQSNLKRHAKVHQMANGGSNASTPGHSANGPTGGAAAHARPIERSHRHPVHPHPEQGFYRHHPLPPPGHVGYAQQQQAYPQPGAEYDQSTGRGQPARAERNGRGSQEMEEGWDEEEDELEDDEADEHEDEK